MSIQDEITRISGQVIQQTDLIGEIKDALIEKGAGSIEEGIKLMANRGITSFADYDMTSIGDYTFYRQASMTSIQTPNVTTIGRNAFSFCGELQSVRFPLCTSYGGDCFSYCYKLAHADLGKPTSIPSWLFASNKLLTVCIIRTEIVPTLTAVNAFNGTPIASGSGYVYVPYALVASYKSTANWTTYANQIRAIEDYPDICG